MKKFLKIFIPLIIIGVVAYQFRSDLGTQFVTPTLQNLQKNVSSIFSKVTPCSEPIPYTIGTFDTKFGISKEYFLSALSDAEAVWEKPFGKDFFTYAPENSSSDVLKINLIYDYRQQATNEIADLGIVVQNNKASYDELKAKFTALQTELTKAKSDYDAHVESFNTDQSAYEKQVEYWNARGGALKAEYDKLNNEKAALSTRASGLKAEQAQINGMVDQINSVVVVLNRLASALNLSVTKYNGVNSSLSESFEEGVFESANGSRKIDIYEFSNREKLVRVLAHELGHALGLDHVADPKAMMYSLNQGNSLTLTQDDINELKAKCGIK